MQMSHDCSLTQEVKTYICGVHFFVSSSQNNEIITDVGEHS